MICRPDATAAYRSLNFVRLLFAAPRPIAFGVLHTFASSPGQTYIVALFVPGVVASFAVSESGFALIYSAVTIASAFLLPVVGRLIDRTDILAYSIASAALVGLGAAVMAAAPNVALLIAGVLALRFAGQGLMSHVAMTGTARFFERDRGKALALVSLGFPMAEATLPLLTLLLIDAWGWRIALAAVGVGMTGVVVVLGALLIGPQRAFRRLHAAPSRRDAPIAAPARSPLLQPGFAMVVPLLCGTPFVVTALIFHQGLLAARTGIAIEWFAASFTMFAAAQVAGNFAVGPAIDRFGAWTIMPMHLAPFAIGLALFAAFDSAWAVPVYLGAAGLSSGMANTIRTAVVAEFVPLERLGAARSQLNAIAILTSAMGPPLLAWMLDAGASVAFALWASCGYTVLATALAVAAPRPRPAG